MDELDPKQLEQLRAAREKLHAKPLVSRNPAWRFCQFILCFGIVMPLLKIGLPLFLGLKIENRKAFRQLKGQGYVIVCNHVHPMDCTMIGVAANPRHIIFTSQEETFYVRGLGLLLRLLNCVPVLTGMSGLRTFLDTMVEELEQGRVVSVYPESEIDMCCDHLRKFSDGAFSMAVRAQVPVLPMVVTPREPTGFRKLFKREYSMLLTVGEPIAPLKVEEGESQKKTIHTLRDTTKAAMEILLQNGGHAYPKKDLNNKDAFWQVKKSKGLKK